MSSFFQWLEDVISFWESLFSRANGRTVSFREGVSDPAGISRWQGRSSTTATSTVRDPWIPKPPPPDKMTGGYGPKWGVNNMWLSCCKCFCMFLLQVFSFISLFLDASQEFGKKSIS